MEDSNPERRNLIVTSLAITFFIVAGGHFNGEVQLQVINAKFYRQSALVWFVWLAFIWFWYRYWLKNRKVFGQKFHDEIKRFLKDERIVEIIKERLLSDTAVQQVLAKRNPKASITPSIRSITAFKLQPKFDVAYTLHFNGADVGGNNYHTVEMKSPRFIWDVVVLHLKTFLLEESFTDYIIPHVLAMVTVFAGLFVLFNQ